MDRPDIDEEAILILDRFYAGMLEPMAWPLAGAHPGEPMGAVLAWLRAGARDPRCLWWAIQRCGTEELIDALDEVRDARPESDLVQSAHAWAMSWLRLLATEAEKFERGADLKPVCHRWRHQFAGRVWDWREA